MGGGELAQYTHIHTHILLLFKIIIIIIIEKLKFVCWYLPAIPWALFGCQWYQGKNTDLFW